MKKKFELEYPLRTSTKMLFPRLSTPSGLAEWFADNVNILGNVYTFIWDKQGQKAIQSYVRENIAVKYEWVEDGGKTFFEFRLRIDELTGDLSLIITDFAEEDEKDETIELWDTQILKLKQSLGL